jgi:hypothetical protein
MYIVFGVSKFQGFKVSRNQGFEVSSIQDSLDFEISWFLRFLGFKETRSGGF